MKNIEQTVLERYHIDISTTNIFKLYKLESADISPMELEGKFAACRKKWQTSVNGANEKFAERDKLHLEKADTYEKILKDNTLRRELHAYYNKPAGAGDALIFAEKYFNMVGSTRSITKKEAEFFFAYFPEQRKNRKLIHEMLKKTYHVKNLGSDDKETDEDKKAEGRKKSDSTLISSRFQNATILNLRKCEMLRKKGAGLDKVSTRYPKIREPMYSFLELDKSAESSDLKNNVDKMRTEVYNLRQEQGQEYTPLVDFFNNLSEILEYNDVIDNFSEFKLLIQYPELTPYMYVFEDMKKDALKDFYIIAKEYYGFRDLNDFILSYFLPIYENFGIYDQGIKSVLKNAKGKEGKKKALDKIDKLLGITKDKSMPLVVKGVHILTCWPIYLLFLFFETIKLIVQNMRYISIAGFFPMLFLMLKKGPEFFGPPISELGRVGWMAFLEDFISIYTNIRLEVILSSLSAGIILFMLFVFPIILLSLFLWHAASGLHKNFDWKGVERTIKMILQEAKQSTERKYQLYKEKIFIKSIPDILANIIGAALITWIITKIPGFLIFITTSFKEFIQYLIEKV